VVLKQSPSSFTRLSSKSGSFDQFIKLDLCGRRDVVPHSIDGPVVSHYGATVIVDQELILVTTRLIHWVTHLKAAMRWKKVSGEGTRAAAYHQGADCQIFAGGGGQSVVQPQSRQLYPPKSSPSPAVTQRTGHRSREDELEHSGPAHQFTNPIERNFGALGCRGVSHTSSVRRAARKKERVM
jgi:hypothetical protein